MVSRLLRGVYEVASVVEKDVEKSVDNPNGKIYYYNLFKLSGSSIKNKKDIDMLPDGEKDLIQYHCFSKPLGIETIFTIRKIEEDDEIERRFDLLQKGDNFAIDKNGKIFKEKAVFNSN